MVGTPIKSKCQVFKPLSLPDHFFGGALPLNKSAWQIRLPFNGRVKTFKGRVNMEGARPILEIGGGRTKPRRRPFPNSLLNINRIPLDIKPEGAVRQHSLH